MSPRTEIPPDASVWGTVTDCDGSVIRIDGLQGLARIGDMVRVEAGGGRIPAEIVAIRSGLATAMLMAPPRGLASGQRAYLAAAPAPRPSVSWAGQVIDAFGRTADGRLAPSGDQKAVLDRLPLPGAGRRTLGVRLATGQSALDTLLPLCRGQRLGLFAGSGVGKSILLADLARGVHADFAVVGLIGERGREVSEFARRVHASGAGARTVIIAATSDQTALVKRRAAMLALATAEVFRDKGAHVLCLLDSVTRVAEAHREIALAAGEAPALRAFPPSTQQVVASLCERAGPGLEDDPAMGDITGIFSVLVSGSDLDEPVADMVRGILDGHVVLDRGIAERGRFPAIDLRRSVSRSAPAAWNADEAALATRARLLIARYEEAEPMIRAGLYTAGSDPVIDEAIALWPALDAFIGSPAERGGDRESFARLDRILAQEHQDRPDGSVRSETRRE